MSLDVIWFSEVTVFYYEFKFSVLCSFFVTKYFCFILFCFTCEGREPLTAEIRVWDGRIKRRLIVERMTDITPRILLLLVDPCPSNVTTPSK